MRAPYRIAVAGPGGLGLCAIRETQRLPELELAAVLAYSSAKDGVDAGTLAGIGEIGVKATTDLDVFLKSDIECVLHCGRDFGDFRTDDEIIRMLEGGINVITMLPYHYLKARGAEVEARFKAAAEKGGATLHGAGITPGFFNERMAMMATGLTNDVTHVKFAEYINIWPLAGALEMLQMFGFGAPGEAVSDAAAMLAQNYLTMPIYYAAEKLGLTVDRIERTGNLAESPIDIEAPVMTIKAGTIGMVSYSWTGYVADRPFYTTEVYWYLGDGMRPAIAQTDDFWTIDIEGRPSLAITIAGKASFQNDVVISPDEPVPSSYVMTVVAMVQAVPAVIDAAPGLMLPALPQFHWKPDMRA